MSWLRPLLICVLGTVHGQLVSGRDVEVAYTFRRSQSGGVARVLIDTAGAFVQQTILFDRPDCLLPKKLRRAAGGRLLIATTEQSTGPNVFLVGNMRDGRRKVLPVEVSSVPDELRVNGRWALITSEDDSVTLLDLKRGKIKRRWRADKKLQPPGNAPQDIFFLPDGKQAIISFQKDGRSGRKRGSRLAVLTIPKLKLMSDAALPRNRPDLHIPGNLREQGPSPEVVLALPKHDRIVVSLDLYGGVAIGKLSHLLENRTPDWQYISTATDESWGAAFPDRMALFGLFAFVCNAGENGGVALVDVMRARVVWRRPTPPGLETPVWVPGVRKVFSVCSGKRKRRAGREIEKVFLPQRVVYEFDFSSREAASSAPVKEHILDHEVTKLTYLGDDSQLLLLAMGKSNQPDQLATFDTTTGEIRDRMTAVGSIVRFESE